ncbi:hypothetical protein [Kribbella sp. NPDC023855]|uniref:hypothetical protein n=1 Tax=Kribbella sp. NPDC023855 TaxID=3154698 RepID=UPI0033C03F56
MAVLLGVVAVGPLVAGVLAGLLRLGVLASPLGLGALAGPLSVGVPAAVPTGASVSPQPASTTDAAAASAAILIPQ